MMDENRMSPHAANIKPIYYDQEWVAEAAEFSGIASSIPNGCSGFASFRQNQL